jgi:XTP/dITP diphosphohydrolase
MSEKFQLVIASLNKGKVEEISSALSGLNYEIKSLSEIKPDLVLPPEDGDTLLMNAQKKALFTAQTLNCLCLADDTGLEVEALEGRPGIFSARWAGEGLTDQQRNMKLLEEISKSSISGREAVFRTVMVIADSRGRQDWAEGRCRGLITTEIKGRAGFGYDPIFFVPKYKKTFAEMNPEEKNKVSHRGEALKRIRILLERW